MLTLNKKTSAGARTMNLILVGFLSILLLPTLSFAQIKVHPELRRTDPNLEPVWTIEPINDSGAYRAMTNNSGTVFIVTDEGIILADPINPEFAAWLKEEFDRRFGVPVKYVVYSHYHWDHASGGGVFADTATFVGHANIFKYLEMPPESTTLDDVIGQYEPVAALDTNGNGVVERDETPVDMQRFPGSHISIFDGFDANKDNVLTGAEIKRTAISFVYPPDITFTDEIEISLGGHRVHMSWLGEMNHTHDSSLITFPDDDLMLAVDYVSFRFPNREMDYELGGYEEWLAAIKKTEELAKDYSHLATGHGRFGTWTDVTLWREYFEDLQFAVEGAIAAGQTLEAMQESISMDEYKDVGWDRFDWVDENVEGMYHFLTDF
jgi:glyoxylase-like metal-dependent hydrolase (beta-lactamase superfamily II)